MVLRNIRNISYKFRTTWVFWKSRWCDEAERDIASHRIFGMWDI